MIARQTNHENTRTIGTSSAMAIDIPNNGANRKARSAPNTNATENTTKKYESAANRVLDTHFLLR